MMDYSAGSVYVKKSMLSFMIANLIRAVESYTQPEAFIHRHPNVDRSSAKRDAVLDWLEENSPASARQIAETFAIPLTTAHFYLNTLIDNGCVMRTNGEKHFLFKVVE